MRIKKSHESGSLMVEVIAVLALLGVMGTMMFRQIQRRNEELDNINMATEIRMIKEATAAYIQANRSALEANVNYCNPAVIDPPESRVDTNPLYLSAVEKFLPDNWISDPGEGNGIIYEYRIYLSCYRVNSAAADNRIAMYATIVPNAPDSGASPLPPDFPLRRAARVAALIGADGGIHDKNEDDFVGTMGAWQIPCAGEDTDGICEGRDDNFYVATTGMDIYVPEVENSADNTVAVPHNIAFQNLHTTDYFSVGDGSINCVTNYDTTNDRFAHEDLGPSGSVVRQAQDDTIADPWTGDCAPLFWVGRDGNAGHVYVKKNLYVGRDENGRQAVSIETGSHNQDRAITVHNASGHSTITLNGAGEVIGRVDSGNGYRLDAANREIVLFKEETVDIDGVTRRVQIPTMRLRDGRMETNVSAKYHDGANEVTSVYAVDPAGESLMNDIRLTSRGGARLSEILPNYILKGTQTIAQPTNGTTTNVTKPNCPHGYAAAIMVTPTRYSQYVKDVNFYLNLETNSTNGSGEHTHSISGTMNTIMQTDNGLVVNGIDGGVSGSELDLTQFSPVNIAITDGYAGWNVALTYGTEAPTAEDPITALAQTYCVYDDTNRDATISPNAASSEISEPTGGLKIDGKEAATLTPTTRSCTTSSNCWNSETCVDGYCKLLGTCTNGAGETQTQISGKLYCVNGTQVYLECFNDTDCGAGEICENNRCATASP
ncbi:MAG: hypothetical protein IKS41_00920 [Alphaproteobacteria bacterium]|nr:hypothetical protein [Alphaproteobacteria bacterium]